MNVAPLTATQVATIHQQDRPDLRPVGLRVHVIASQGSHSEALTFLLNGAPHLGIRATLATFDTLTDPGEIDSDVILLLACPTAAGEHLASLGLLRSRHPDLPIVLMPCSPEQRMVRQAMSVGVSAILSGATPVSELANALHIIQSGGIVLVNPPPAGGDVIPFPELEPIESKLLELLSRGLDTEEISAELVMSVSTVKRVTRRLLRSLNVSNKAEALVSAAKLGLI